MSHAVVAQAVGVDLVHVPSFAAQLAEPGSVFSRVFTDREWSYCASLPSGIDEGEARPSRTEASLAARWAAKEAVIKAWSGLLYGRPPQVAPEEVDWAHIEVTPDRWGRPGVTFHGRIRAALEELRADLGANVHLDWSLSLSHDHDQAIAFVTVTALKTLEPAALDPDSAPGQSARPDPTELSPSLRASQEGPPISSRNPASSQGANSLSTWPT
ncbi:MAG: holo-ACP synthase [Actinomycetaceae bacterium]|nr:holo-ACP synthase [Actinomycetaceae bacterium]